MPESNTPCITEFFTMIPDSYGNYQCWFKQEDCQGNGPPYPSQYVDADCNTKTGPCSNGACSHKRYTRPVDPSEPHIPTDLDLNGNEWARPLVANRRHDGNWFRLVNTASNPFDPVGFVRTWSKTMPNTTVRFAGYAESDRPKRYFVLYEIFPYTATTPPTALMPHYIALRIVGRAPPEPRKQVSLQAFRYRDGWESRQDFYGEVNGSDGEPRTFHFRGIGN